jgi:hypothetical protein
MVAFEGKRQFLAAVAGFDRAMEYLVPFRYAVDGFVHCTPSLPVRAFACSAAEQRGSKRASRSVKGDAAKMLKRCFKDPSPQAILQRPRDCFHVVEGRTPLFR